MVLDPVCGMEADEPANFSYPYSGAEYSFCSESCLKQFMHDPSNYIEAKRAGVSVEQIRPSVYWVGVIDPFVQRPINSYLIVDEKSTLIYNSTSALKTETMAKITEVIDYLKSNFPQVTFSEQAVKAID